MDPELKAAVRGLKVGSKEYQKALDAAIAKRDARQQSSADAAAKRKRDDEDAQAERDRRAQAEKEAREQRTGMVAAGSFAGGVGAGLAGGKLADHLANEAMRREIAARGAEVSRLASSARAIDPAASGARGLHADIASAAERGRLLNRPVPWGTSLTAAALAGGGLYSTLKRAPEAKSDTERAIWSGTGYGELTTAAKMAADSVRRYRNPGVSLPADDVAAVESSRRMARGAQLGPVAPTSTSEPHTSLRGALAAAFNAHPVPTPPSTPVTPTTPLSPELRHSARLINAARAAGAAGRLNKATAAEYLASNITDQNRGAVARALNVSNGPNLAERLSQAVKTMSSTRGVSSVALPAAAAGLAYAATPGTARAEDGTVAANDGNARLSAAATAAGTAYGLNKAMNAAPSLSAALGSSSVAMAPFAAADLSDSMTEWDKAIGRNWIARNMPFMRHVSEPVREAYEMSQVPPRGDRSDEAMVARDRVTLAEQRPLNSAASLTIPDGIPAPRADGSSPYGDPAASARPGGITPAIERHIQRMQAAGASVEQIARFLNQHAQ